MPLSRAAKNPSHAAISDCKGRVTVITRGSTLVVHCLLLRRPVHHSFDDNGITGPDRGRSEVVFKCFLNRLLPAYAALSGNFRILLVSSSRFLYESTFHYNGRNIFVNHFSLREHRDSARIRHYFSSSRRSSLLILWSATACPSITTIFMTVTIFSCPMRWVLSVAWFWAATFHHGS